MICGLFINILKKFIKNQTILFIPISTIVKIGDV